MSLVSYQRTYERKLPTKEEMKCGEELRREGEIEALVVSTRAVERDEMKKAEVSKHSTATEERERGRRDEFSKSEEKKKQLAKEM